MTGYRILFALAALVAVAFLVFVGMGLLGTLGPSEMLLLVAAAGILFGSRALALQGRPGLACLLLLLLVLPGLLAAAAALYLSAVGFGPHH